MLDDEPTAREATPSRRSKTPGPRRADFVAKPASRDVLRFLQCYEVAVNAERWVQALGAAVTIIGLAVVAPYEAGKALPDLGRWVRRRGRTLRGWLARFLPFLRKAARIHATAATAWAIGGTATVTANGSVVPSGATLAERVDILWREMDEVRAEIATLRAGTETQFGKVEQRIQEQVRALADLESRVNQLFRDAARLNARGFPLAALGTLLAGVPFWFVSLWWTPLFLLAVALGASFLREAAPRIREGWSARAL